MIDQKYKKQVELLLNVLPEVAKEDCFAVHGGTAINLFVRNMPRLSVDIDLTYVPIEDRETSLSNISDALKRINKNIEKTIQGVKIQEKLDQGKLIIVSQGIEIKLEVNLTKRGTLIKPKQMILCENAQNEFEVSLEMPVVSMGELYGGKLCAALDRQHPRDLFDVKLLLNLEGITNEIKTGFIFLLLGSSRPINEIIQPNFHDQKSALDNHFTGMSVDDFTYEEYEKTREELVKIIHENLTDEDKKFILSVKDLKPDWSIYNFEAFPAVQFKLRNLQLLKEKNPAKHAEQYEVLKQKLYK